MAKDPAFLFYSADFLVGTALMSETEVGQYVKIMCHIHQSGHLTMEDMKNICPNISLKVVSKFKKDKEGKFFNERLEEEIQKRKKYSESRRNNRLKKKTKTHDITYDKTYVNHMSTHMENENEDVNEIENKLNSALDEIYLDQQKIKWPHLDFDFEYRSFCEKVRGSPDHYANHDTGGIRLAFQSQLRYAKPKQKHGINKNEHPAQTAARNFAERHGLKSV